MEPVKTAPFSIAIAVNIAACVLLAVPMILLAAAGGAVRQVGRLLA